MTRAVPPYDVERSCIVTRAVKPEAELIRFVRSPEGEVVPDLRGVLTGRGAWVSLSREKIAEAVKRRLFARAFGAEAQAAADLDERVGILLRKHALGLISLARKAGQAVSGSVKVEEMVRKNRAQILLHAVEAAPDGCRKIDNLATPLVKVIKLFKVDELDLAFGRSNVIHAAVGAGGLAHKLLLAVEQITRYDAQNLECPPDVMLCDIERA